MVLVEDCRFSVEDLDDGFHVIRSLRRGNTTGLGFRV